jgi:hypothetical protein
MQSFVGALQGAQGSRGGRSMMTNVWINDFSNILQLVRWW